MHEFSLGRNRENRNSNSTAKVYPISSVERNTLSFPPIISLIRRGNRGKCLSRALGSCNGLLEWSEGVPHCWLTSYNGCNNQTRGTVSSWNKHKESQRGCMSSFSVCALKLRRYCETWTGTHCIPHPVYNKYARAACYRARWFLGPEKLTQSSPPSYSTPTFYEITGKWRVVGSGDGSIKACHSAQGAGQIVLDERDGTKDQL